MKIIFSWIVISILLFADTINEQIHALENASPTQRVALMNQIKSQLVSMNEKKRKNTLSKLRKKLHATKYPKGKPLSSSKSKSEDRTLEHHERQEQHTATHSTNTLFHQHQERR